MELSLEKPTEFCYEREEEGILDERIQHVCKYLKVQVFRERRDLLILSVLSRFLQ